MLLGWLFKVHLGGFELALFHLLEFIDICDHEFATQGGGHLLLAAACLSTLLERFGRHIEVAVALAGT